jgi:uncharacterized membrane-anchored protein YjiN (DUF445 family)
MGVRPSSIGSGGATVASPVRVATVARQHRHFSWFATLSTPTRRTRRYGDRVASPDAPAPTTLLLGGYDDRVGRARLRRMKATATGLLAVAGAIYLTSFALGDSTAVGYLRAAAEAGMVGGLADWFAVTALFRHPLRLPIPHTALIPRKKDDIATKLGEFVSGNFITPDAVLEHVARADLVHKAGARLLEPKTADFVGREVARAISGVVGSLDDKLLARVVLEHLQRNLDRHSFAREVGRLLATAVENHALDPVLDLTLPRIRAHLIAHRVATREEVQRFLDGQGLAARLWATDRRVDKLLLKVVDTLDEMVAEGRTHPIRRQLDDLVSRFADGLRHDAGAADGLDQTLRGLAAHPAIESWLGELLAQYLDSARDLLADPSDSLAAQLSLIVQRLGERLTTDAEFAAGLNRALEQAVRYAVSEYGDQIVTLISTQVARWNAEDASRRIETAVGRDLQFIRINGTVVGAIAGVAIHTVAVATGNG